MKTTAYPFRIRVATEADIGGCLDIYAPIVRETAISFEFEPPTREELARRLLHPGHSKLTLVAVKDDRIAGYAYATQFRGRPAYDWSVESSVYVHPDFRRRGVAQSLYRVLLGGLDLAGYRMVIAGITQPNPASMKLHEQLGFEHVGTTNNVGYKFEQWHDVGFCQLDLGATEDNPSQRLHPTRADELTKSARFREYLRRVNEQ